MADAAILAALIAEQAADDLAEVAEPSGPRTVREADLTIVSKSGRRRGSINDLDPRRLRAELTGGRFVRLWVFLDSCRPMEAWEQELVRRGVMACPACGSGPIVSPSHYCEECDRCGSEGLAARDGLPVDAEPRWDFVREHCRPKTERAGKYAGGRK